MKVSVSNNQYKNQNFKATFPVVHWVRESNGSFAPVARRDIVEQLQEKIITYLGKPLLPTSEVKQLKKDEKAKKKSKNYVTKRLTEVMDVNVQRFRAYLSMVDPDYRNATEKTKVRSFYNNTEGGVNNKYAMSYIITGNNVADFDNRFSKKIGRELRNTKNIRAERAKALREQYILDTSSGKKDAEIRDYYSEEVNRIKEFETEGLKKARKNYNQGGLQYVNNYLRRIKDTNGKTQTLHTKFEIIRDDTGEIIGYKFLDARFLPEFGPESPLEKLKYWIG